MGQRWAWASFQSHVNIKGAAHHWLPSFWIGRISFNPLMRYIKPHTPRPPPLLYGGSIRRLSLACQLGWSRHSPRAEPPKHLPKHWLGGGRDVRGEVWLGSFFRRLVVSWWFLRIYMRSGLYYSWFFLRIFLWFFWYFLRLWALANYCRAGIKSLRGTVINKFCEYFYELREKSFVLYIFFERKIR